MLKSQINTTCKGSFDFVYNLKQFSCNSDVKMLSLDIENMYPSIPLKYIMDKAADILVQAFVALQRYSRTVYGTLYSTFTKYVVLSRCYGVTKARPCTGRTLYKCLHTSFNLGKHINFFSFRLFSSRAVYFSFYFLFFYFSSTFGLMTKCSNTVCTEGVHT